MNPTTNERDTTIDEIHATREKIHETFHGNLLAMVRDANQRQVESGREILPAPAHPPLQTIIEK